MFKKEDCIVKISEESATNTKTKMAQEEKDEACASSAASSVGSSSSSSGSASSVTDCSVHSDEVFTHQSLRALIDSQCYFDKTIPIHNFVGKHPSRCVMIIRPNGFGKTTLLDTIEALYTHDFDTLQGTDILKSYTSSEEFDPLHVTKTAHRDPLEPKLVLRLDFEKLINRNPWPYTLSVEEQYEAITSELKDRANFIGDSDVDILVPKLYMAIYNEMIAKRSFLDNVNDELLKDNLATLEVKAGSASERTAFAYLNDLIEQLTEQSTVLLIDNLEAPLLQCIDNPELYNFRHRVMVNFLNMLERHRSKFKHIIITSSVSTRIFNRPLARSNSICQLTIDTEFSNEWACNDLVGLDFEVLQAQEYEPLLQRTLQAYQKAHGLLVPLKYFSPREYGVMVKVGGKKCYATAPKSEEQLNEIQYKLLLLHLRDNYGNYSFDKHSNCLNLISLHNFLRHPERGFKSYFFLKGKLNFSNLKSLCSLDLDHLERALLRALKPVVVDAHRTFLLPHYLRPRFDEEEGKSLDEEGLENLNAAQQLANGQSQNAGSDGDAPIKLTAENLDFYLEQQEMLKEERRKLSRDDYFNTSAIFGWRREQGKVADKAKGGVAKSNRALSANQESVVAAAQAVSNGVAQAQTSLQASAQAASSEDGSGAIGSAKTSSVENGSAGRDGNSAIAQGLQGALEGKKGFGVSVAQTSLQALSQAASHEDGSSAIGSAETSSVENGSAGRDGNSAIAQGEQGALEGKKGFGDTAANDSLRNGLNGAQQGIKDSAANGYNADSLVNASLNVSQAAGIQDHARPRGSLTGIDGAESIDAQAAHAQANSAQGGNQAFVAHGQAANAQGASNGVAAHAGQKPSSAAQASTQPAASAAGQGFVAPNKVPGMPASIAKLKYEELPYALQGVTDSEKDSARDAINASDKALSDLQSVDLSSLSAMDAIERLAKAAMELHHTLSVHKDIFDAHPQDDNSAGVNGAQGSHGLNANGSSSDGSADALNPDQLSLADQNQAEAIARSLIASLNGISEDELDELLAKQDLDDQSLAKNEKRNQSHDEQGKESRALDDQSLAKNEKRNQSYDEQSKESLVLDDQSLAKNEKRNESRALDDQLPAQGENRDESLDEGCSAEGLAHGASAQASDDPESSVDTYVEDIEDELLHRKAMILGADRSTETAEQIYEQVQELVQEGHVYDELKREALKKEQQLNEQLASLGDLGAEVLENNSQGVLHIADNLRQLNMLRRMDPTLGMQAHLRKQLPKGVELITLFFSMGVLTQARKSNTGSVMHMPNREVFNAFKEAFEDFFFSAEQLERLPKVVKDNDFFPYDLRKSVNLIRDVVQNINLASSSELDLHALIRAFILWSLLNNEHGYNYAIGARFITFYEDFCLDKENPYFNPHPYVLNPEPRVWLDQDDNLVQGKEYVVLKEYPTPLSAVFREPKDEDDKDSGKRKVTLEELFAQAEAIERAEGVPLDEQDAADEKQQGKEAPRGYVTDNQKYAQVLFDTLEKNAAKHQKEALEGEKGAKAALEGGNGADPSSLQGGNSAKAALEDRNVAANSTLVGGNADGSSLDGSEDAETAPNDAVQGMPVYDDKKAQKKAEHEIRQNKFRQMTDEERAKVDADYYEYYANLHKNEHLTRIVSEANEVGVDLTRAQAEAIYEKQLQAESAADAQAQVEGESDEQVQEPSQADKLANGQAQDASQAKDSSHAQAHGLATAKSQEQGLVKAHEDNASHEQSQEPSQAQANGLAKAKTKTQVEDASVEQGQEPSHAHAQAHGLSKANAQAQALASSDASNEAHTLEGSSSQKNSSQAVRPLENESALQADASSKSSISEQATSEQDSLSAPFGQGDIAPINSPLGMAKDPNALPFMYDPSSDEVKDGSDSFDGSEGADGVNGALGIGSVNYAAMDEDTFAPVKERSFELLSVMENIFILEQEYNFYQRFNHVELSHNEGDSSKVRPDGLIEDKGYDEWLKKLVEQKKDELKKLKEKNAAAQKEQAQEGASASSDQDLDGAANQDGSPKKALEGADSNSLESNALHGAAHQGSAALAAALNSAPSSLNNGAHSREGQGSAGVLSGSGSYEGSNDDGIEQDGARSLASSSVAMDSGSYGSTLSAMQGVSSDANADYEVIEVDDFLARASKRIAQEKDQVEAHALEVVRALAKKREQDEQILADLKKARALAGLDVDLPISVLRVPPHFAKSDDEALNHAHDKHLALWALDDLLTEKQKSDLIVSWALELAKSNAAFKALVAKYSAPHLRVPKYDLSLAELSDEFYEYLYSRQEFFAFATTMVSKQKTPLSSLIDMADIEFIFFADTAVDHYRSYSRQFARSNALAYKRAFAPTLLEALVDALGINPFDVVTLESGNLFSLALVAIYLKQVEALRSKTHHEKALHALDVEQDTLIKRVYKRLYESLAYGRESELYEDFKERLRSVVLASLGSNDKAAQDDLIAHAALVASYEFTAQELTLSDGFEPWHEITNILNKRAQDIYDKQIKEEERKRREKEKLMARFKLVSEEPGMKSVQAAIEAAGLTEDFKYLMQARAAHNKQEAEERKRQEAIEEAKERAKVGLVYDEQEEESFKKSHANAHGEDGLELDSSVIFMEQDEAQYDDIEPYYVKRGEYSEDESSDDAYAEAEDEDESSEYGQVEQEEDETSQSLEVNDGSARRDDPSAQGQFVQGTLEGGKQGVENRAESLNNEQSQGSSLEVQSSVVSETQASSNGSLADVSEARSSFVEESASDLAELDAELKKAGAHTLSVADIDPALSSDREAQEVVLDLDRVKTLISMSYGSGAQADVKAEAEAASNLSASGLEAEGSSHLNGSDAEEANEGEQANEAVEDTASQESMSDALAALTQCSTQGVKSLQEDGLSDGSGAGAVPEMDSAEVEFAKKDLGMGESKSSFGTGTVETIVLPVSNNTRLYPSLRARKVAIRCAIRALEKVKERKLETKKASLPLPDMKQAVERCLDVYVLNFLDLIQGSDHPVSYAIRGLPIFRELYDWYHLPNAKFYADPEQLPSSDAKLASSGVALADAARHSDLILGIRRPVSDYQWGKQIDDLKNMIERSEEQKKLSQEQELHDLEAMVALAQMSKGAQALKGSGLSNGLGNGLSNGQAGFNGQGDGYGKGDAYERLLGLGQAPSHSQNQSHNEASAPSPSNEANHDGMRDGMQESSAVEGSESNLADLIMARRRERFIAKRNKQLEAQEQGWQSVYGFNQSDKHGYRSHVEGEEQEQEQYLAPDDLGSHAEHNAEVALSHEAALARDEQGYDEQGHDKELSKAERAALALEQGLVAPKPQSIEVIDAIEELQQGLKELHEAKEARKAHEEGKSADNDGDLAQEGSVASVDQSSALEGDALGSNAVNNEDQEGKSEDGTVQSAASASASKALVVPADSTYDKNEYSFLLLESNYDLAQHMVNSWLNKISRATCDEERIITDFKGFINIKRQALVIINEAVTNYGKFLELLRLYDLAKRDGFEATKALLLSEIDKLRPEYGLNREFENSQEESMANLQYHVFAKGLDLSSILFSQFDLIANSKSIKDKLFRLESLIQIAEEQKLSSVVATIYNFQQKYQSLAKPKNIKQLEANAAFINAVKVSAEAAKTGDFTALAEVKVDGNDQDVNAQELNKADALYQANDNAQELAKAHSLADEQAIDSANGSEFGSAKALEGDQAQSLAKEKAFANEQDVNAQANGDAQELAKAHTLADGQANEFANSSELGSGKALECVQAQNSVIEQAPSYNEQDAQAKSVAKAMVDGSASSSKAPKVKLLESDKELVDAISFDDGSGNKAYEDGSDIKYKVPQVATMKDIKAQIRFNKLSKHEHPYKDLPDPSQDAHPNKAMSDEVVSKEHFNKLVEKILDDQEPYVAGGLRGHKGLAAMLEGSRPEGFDVNDDAQLADQVAAQNSASNASSLNKQSSLDDQEPNVVRPRGYKGLAAMLEGSRPEGYDVNADAKGAANSSVKDANALNAENALIAAQCSQDAKTAQAAQESNSAQSSDGAAHDAANLGANGLEQGSSEGNAHAAASGSDKASEGAAHAALNSDGSTIDLKAEFALIDSQKSSMLKAMNLRRLMRIAHEHGNREIELQCVYSLNQCLNDLKKKSDEAGSVVRSSDGLPRIELPKVHFSAMPLGLDDDEDDIDLEEVKLFNEAFDKFKAIYGKAYDEESFKTASKGEYHHHNLTIFNDNSVLLFEMVMVDNLSKVRLAADWATREFLRVQYPLSEILAISEKEDEKLKLVRIVLVLLRTKEALKIVFARVLDSEDGVKRLSIV